MNAPGQSPESRIVIVGAGHAGGSAAAFLRQFGHEGPIVMIGDEPVAPYQRPPLSKAWLKGEADAESLLLKPADWYPENGVSLRLNQRAVRLDRTARTLETATGETFAYDILILATGARASRLPIPGANLDGVLALRSAADAEALKARLGPGRRLVVIGGGYVGLEAAASALALGGSATVIEREPRLLARVASEALSAFYRQAHERRGVTVVTGAEAASIAGEDGRARAVILADGRRIEADVVLVGVGAVPETALAVDSGLAGLNGVVVDEQARTPDPCVFAIGDVTWRPLPLYARDGRLESVPNALEQARQAACAIMGRPAPAPEVPWFWSDQFDLKLQMAGVPLDSDRQVLRGDPAAERFAVFHLRGDVVRAVEAVNAPPEFMMGRQLIGRGVAVDAARLADASVSMKAVAA